jgi:hypothetical protein
VTPGSRAVRQRKRANILAMAVARLAWVLWAVTGCELVGGVDDRAAAPGDTTSALASSTSSTGASGGAGGQGGLGGQAGQGGGAGLLTTQHVATVAECLDTMLPTTADCEVSLGRMLVDLSSPGVSGVSTAYLRFDIDAPPPGATTAIDAALHLFTTPEMDADSSNGGELWQTTEFTAMSLDTRAEPTAVEQLAADLGPIAENAEAVWTFNPTGAVTPGVPVCLAVVPVHTNGVYYWNLEGQSQERPRLVVSWR